MTITPNEIVTHLQTFVPAFSDKFSTAISGATATASGTTVTVLATAHGFNAADPIVVSAGEFENLLIGAFLTGDDTVRFETDQEHDLTQPQQPADPTTLILAGIGSPWDGTHTIDAVPNRQTFEIELPSGETDAPILTASSVLIEDRPAGIIGKQIVATVPNDNSFTFEVTTVPELPIGDVLNFAASGTLRIYAAANIQRAEAFYNALATDELTMFVIMGDVTVSKDRNTKSDAIAENTSQDFQKQTILNDFSTVVFFPASDDAAANAAVQSAYGEIYNVLLSVLYGVQFEDINNALTFNTVSRGHGAGLYNTAWYEHVYDWQRPDVVSHDQGFNLQPDVAFRDIGLTLDQDGEELTAEIDLDEEGPFTPNELADLFVWYDPSDEASLSTISGNVALMTDLSGNDNDAIQTDTDMQPTTGVETINSLNTLGFDGSDDFLEKTALALEPSITVFMALHVISITSGTQETNQSAISFDDTDATPNDFQIRNAVMGEFLCDLRDSNLGIGTLQAPSDLLAQDFFFTLTLDAVEEASNLWISGTLEDTANYNGDLSSSLDLMLGVSRDGNAFLDFKCGEVLVYNRVLSLPEIDRVNTYFTDKWLT